jgi:hypothetical protein
MTKEYYMTEEAKIKKRAYDKLWREKHKAEIKAYREKNKEKIQEQIKNYKETHKEDISEKNKVYQKKYHSEHKEEIREYNRKYSRKLEKKAKEELTTDMYIFPQEVTIVNSKTVKFNNRTYRIKAKGYLRSTSTSLHIDIAKAMGIWFENCEVHHINGSVFNNSKNNLIALTVEEHRYAHTLLKENKEAYEQWINEIKNKKPLYLSI